MIRSVSKDGLLTTTAIGALAYVIAAMVHEAGGHGAMCLAMGGHLSLLTSLFLECDLHRPLIAVAGPLANVSCGLMALGLAYQVRDRSAMPHLHLFSWLLAAYSLFFGAGYLLFSGVTGSGDWAFVFGIARPNAAQRVAMIVLGGAATAACLRLVLAAHRRPMPKDRSAPHSDRILAIYVAATLISLAAAALDPAGLRAVVHLPPAAPFAGLGLLWIRRWLRRRSGADLLRVVEVPCHRGWVVAGVLAVGIFIGALGPGIRFGR